MITRRRNKKKNVLNKTYYCVLKAFQCFIHKLYSKLSKKILPMNKKSLSILPNFDLTLIINFKKNHFVSYHGDVFFA